MERKPLSQQVVQSYVDHALLAKHVRYGRFQTLLHPWLHIGKAALDLLQTVFQFPEVCSTSGGSHIDLGLKPVGFPVRQEEVQHKLFLFFRRWLVGKEEVTGFVQPLDGEARNLPRRQAVAMTHG